MITEKQATVEVRNTVYQRIVEAGLNKSYWQEVMKRAKTNTQEAVEANQMIRINTENIKKDKLFLKIIDKKLSKIKE